MNRYAPTRQQPRTPRVDREKTCPSLLRVFVNQSQHHADNAFTSTSLPTTKEHQVYVWRDSTLREILLCLRDASPALRSNNFAKYSLKLVFWDSKADKYTSTDLALVQAKDLAPVASHNHDRRAPGGPGGGGSSAVLQKTLAEAKYVVGDFIDIAYILPTPASTVPTGSNSNQGPQFAPLAAPSGPRGQSSGVPAGPRGSGGPRNGGGPPGPPGGGGAFGGRIGGDSRGDQFAPRQGGGGVNGMRGGGRFGGGRPAPADAGWGNRRGRTESAPSRDAVPRQGRRDSRSLSPDHARRPRSTSRQRSRSPVRNGGRAGGRDRSKSPESKRSPLPPRGDDDDVAMKD